MTPGAGGWRQSLKLSTPQPVSPGLAVETGDVNSPTARQIAPPTLAPVYWNLSRMPTSGQFAHGLSMDATRVSARCPSSPYRKSTGSLKKAEGNLWLRVGESTHWRPSRRCLISQIGIVISKSVFPPFQTWMWAHRLSGDDEMPADERRALRVSSAKATARCSDMCGITVWFFNSSLPPTGRSFSRDYRGSKCRC